MQPIELSEIRFSPAPPEAARTGLLGYASAIVNGILRVDRIAVRRTRRGDLKLSYPTAGKRHAAFLPLGECARGQFSRQILAAIGLDDDSDEGVDVDE